MSGEVERPEPNSGDFDAQFAQIVAGFHSDTPDPPKTSFTELEDLTAASGLSPITSEPDEPGLIDGLDSFGADLPEEDEHYVPPAPPPIPRPTGRAVASVLAIAAGMLLLFWPSLLPVDSQMVMLMGFLGIMGGSWALIMGLRSGDDEDDEPYNDGAQV